jgi:hypothetical protein
MNGCIVVTLSGLCSLREMLATWLGYGSHNATFKLMNEACAA